MKNIEQREVVLIYFLDLLEKIAEIAAKRFGISAQEAGYIYVKVQME